MTVDVVPMADISSSSSSSSSTTSSPSSSSSSSLSSSPSSTRTSSSSSLGSSLSAERVRLSKRKQFRPLRSIKREEAGGPTLQSLLLQNQAHNRQNNTHNQQNQAHNEGDLYEHQIFLASKVIVLDFSAEALLLKGGNDEEANARRNNQQQDSSESEDLDLGENEKELCTSLNLSPSIYVKLKESVLKEGPKVVHKPAFKKKAKMDVSKTKKLYDFFLHQRWQVAQKA